MKGEMSNMVNVMYNWSFSVKFLFCQVCGLSGSIRGFGKLQKAVIGFVHDVQR